MKYICFSNEDRDLINITYKSPNLTILSDTNDILRDSIIFEALILSIEYDLDNINDFIIMSGGSILFSIPFELLRCNMKIINNKYYFTFDKKLFSDLDKFYNTYHDYFEIYKVPYHTLSIKLTSINNLKLKFELLCKTGIYNNNLWFDLRNTLKNYKMLINNYEKFDFKKNNIIETRFSGINSLFIKSYDSIKNILYNNINLEYKIVYHKDYYLYYIEINHKPNKITLNINTDNDIYEGNIIIKKDNYIIYSSGMRGCSYNI